MWKFVDQQIQHTESGLFFENMPIEDNWQISYVCWHQAIRNLSPRKRLDWTRQVRELELECSLWALDRSPLSVENQSLTCQNE